MHRKLKKEVKITIAVTAALIIGLILYFALPKKSESGNTQETVTETAAGQTGENKEENAGSISEEETKDTVISGTVTGSDTNTAQNAVDSDGSAHNQNNGNSGSGSSIEMNGDGTITIEIGEDEETFGE